MYVMHDIIGSKESTLSTFQMRVDGNDIIVLPGQYINQNEVLFETTEEKRFTIPLEKGHYEIWLYPNGTMKVEKDWYTDVPFLDCLLWIEMPEGAQTLEDAELNFKRFVEVE
jgi:hypothetical protein